jgi:hypothetical protein
MPVYGVDQSTYSPTELVIPGFPAITEAQTIVSGAGVLVKGTVLGKITASGKYDAYADAGSGGLDTARRILAEDIDATSEDVVASVFRTGYFNEGAFTGFTASAKADFEGTPILTDVIIL